MDLRKRRWIRARVKPPLKAQGFNSCGRDSERGIPAAKDDLIHRLDLNDGCGAKNGDTNPKCVAAEDQRHNGSVHGKVSSTLQLEQQAVTGNVDEIHPSNPNPVLPVSMGTFTSLVVPAPMLWQIGSWQDVISRSFKSQRHDRIDFGCAMSRDIAGQQGHDAK